MVGHESGYVHSNRLKPGITSGETLTLSRHLTVDLRAPNFASLLGGEKPAVLTLNSEAQRNLRCRELGQETEEAHRSDRWRRQLQCLQYCLWRGVRRIPLVRARYPRVPRCCRWSGVGGCASVVLTNRARFHWPRGGQVELDQDLVSWRRGRSCLCDPSCVVGDAGQWARFAKGGTATLCVGGPHRGRRETESRSASP